MNASIYTHELRSRLRSVLTWSLGVAALLLFYFSFFAAFADQAALMNEMMARFPPQKAAQMSERVFRGGVLTGGAPFTKDAAYQRGYCRTFNFVRAAVEQRDLDLVRAFLAGKMRVDDAELVRDLIDDGLCVGPIWLPEWFIDVDRLNATCTHSVTMNRFSLPSVSRYYARRRAGRRAVTWDAAEPGDAEERPGAAGQDEGDRD